MAKTSNTDGARFVAPQYEPDAAKNSISENRSKPDVATAIVEAIRARALLQFHYNGRLRVVAPYCFGVSTRGVDVLRAIEVPGLATSNGTGFGKLWAVSKMGNPRALDQTFTPNDPQYNPDDSAMTKIYCRV